MNEALETAIHQASKSVEQFRHGAVVMQGAQILAVGRNRNDNPCGLWSIHAEMDALWKLGPEPPRPLHVVVVRLKHPRPDDRHAARHGHWHELGLSRPCPACQKLLRRKGVRRVTYSTGDPSVPLGVEFLN